MIQKEHEYRLTPEGRNTDKILLTIAIPTYHRGHLLLQRMKNLQKLPYDAEIEFTVSKMAQKFIRKNTTKPVR